MKALVIFSVFLILWAISSDRLERYEDHMMYEVYGWEEKE